MKKYISPQGQIAIRNFKYKGGSQAYSYKYLWSPFADFILKKFIPTTIAPNTITLIGLITLIAAWAVIAIQYPIQNRLEPISMIIFAILVFIYQTLDNIDGKQARRTKSSTPLGMLFDHGSDALVSAFLSFSVGRVALIQNQFTLIVSCFLCIQLGFYFSVWVQYYSNGLMILGQVNGIDDGIPACSVIALITYFIGQDFWLSKNFFGLENSYGLICFVSICTITQIFSLIKNTKGQFTKNTLLAISQLFHIVLRLASLLTVMYFTDWYLEGRYFYQIYFSLSLPFIRDITYVQVCVITNQKYKQFSNPTLVYILAYPSYIFGKQYFGVTLLEQSLFINGLMCYFVLEYLHFVLKIIWEVSSALNIKVFKINPIQKVKQQNPQSSSRSSSEDEHWKRL